MALEEDLERWLRRELVKDRGEKPIQKISLRHAAPGTKGNEVEGIDLAERQLGIDDLPAFAEEIVSRAQTDADGIGGGPQRYMINMYPKGEAKAVARFPFRIRPNGDEFEEAGDEPANSRGLLMQLMRHNEANAKTLVHAVSGLTSVMARRLEAADVTISRQSDIISKNAQLLEEAKSDQHNRDMELLNAEMKQKREDKIFEKLSLLVPVVINKLAGQKVFNSEDPSILMITEFAKSLSVEQFSKIQGSLGPEQQVLLMQLMQGIQQKTLPNGTS